jgi:glutathione S-transferase
MLTLYYKPTCPFCQRVLVAAEELGITFDLRDVSADETHAEALIAHGGKRQVPYLIDAAHDVAMYESDDIIAHLQAHHQTTDTPTTLAEDAAETS